MKCDLSLSCNNTIRMDTNNCCYCSSIIHLVLIVAFYHLIKIFNRKFQDDLCVDITTLLWASTNGKWEAIILSRLLVSDFHLLIFPSLQMSRISITDIRKHTNRKFHWIRVSNFWIQFRVFSRILCESPSLLK